MNKSIGRIVTLDEAHADLRKSKKPRKPRKLAVGKPLSSTIQDVARAKDGKKKLRKGPRVIQAVPRDYKGPITPVSGAQQLRTDVPLNSPGKTVTMPQRPTTPAEEYGRTRRAGDKKITMTQRPTTPAEEYGRTRRAGDPPPPRKIQPGSITSRAATRSQVSRRSATVKSVSSTRASSDAGGIQQRHSGESNMKDKDSDKGTDLNKSLGNLFEDEIGKSEDAPIVDCPHCDTPITKSEIAKAMKVKSGPGGKKTDKAREQNNASGEGAHARYGNAPKPHDATVKAGKKVPKTSPAYPKTMAAKKSEADDESVEDVADDASGDETAVETPMAKSVIRGTEHVQYVTDASITGDAAIAKMIAEGGLGQQPTQPIDKNHRKF